MTAQECAAALADRSTVMVPVASIEVLGSHGPLGADYLAANAVVPLIAERADVLYAPTIPYGDTLELPHVAGSVDVGRDALEAYCMKVAESLLCSRELKHVVFISFHSLNLRALDGVCRRLAKKGASAFTIDWWKCVAVAGGSLLTDQEWGSGHGGEMISSVMMHLAPEYMRLDEQTNQLPLEGFSYYKEHLPFTSSPFAAYGTFEDYCEGGAWGDLSLVSKEKGARLVEFAIEDIVGFLGALRTRE